MLVENLGVAQVCGREPVEIGDRTAWPLAADAKHQFVHLLDSEVEPRLDTHGIRCRIPLAAAQKKLQRLRPDVDVRGSHERQDLRGADIEILGQYQDTRPVSLKWKPGAVAFEQFLFDFGEHWNLRGAARLTEERVRRKVTAEGYGRVTGCGGEISGGSVPAVAVRQEAQGCEGRGRIKCGR